MDLRCPHKKFGRLIRPSQDSGQVEMTCPSRWCGKREGVVVLHVFDTRTGQLVSTNIFKQPPKGDGQ